MFHRLAACMTGGLLMVAAHAKITTEPWGKTADEGREANLYALTNADGMEVKLTNYGGIITSIRVPNRDGRRFACGGDKSDVARRAAG